jgi:hypothetical protein
MAYLNTLNIYWTILGWTKKRMITKDDMALELVNY